MIINKRSIAQKRISPYVTNNCLPTAIVQGTTYKLENSNVQFTFTTDPIYGIRLSSFTELSSGKTYLNKSRSLWKLGIKRSIVHDPINNRTMDDTIILHPRHRYFADPGTSETDSTGTFYTFSWNNYPYDPKVPSKLCNIVLTAKIPTGKDCLDLSLVITQVIGISASLLSTGSVLCAVGMPEIIIQKDDDWETDVLVLGSQMGDCTRNPIKNLDSPRYARENLSYYQYKTGGAANYRFEKGGLSSGSPSRNAKRINLGSPGLMSIPLCVFGNRTSKSGFLYYALDSTGLHAKNFQIWSDGRALHMRAWDLSDHEIVPYGVGGKHTDGDVHSTENTIGWSIRIRPFESITKWVDWYGPKLYKDEVVPELEDLGWIPRSFRTQYLEDDLSLSEVEIPFYASTIGHMSGNINDIQSGLVWYQDFYESVSNNGVKPRVLAHTQEVQLNSTPLRSQTAQYWGWTSWATGSSGIASYKSPNYTINSTFSTGPSGANLSGVVDMFYLPWAYNITSGSTFVSEVSGMDIVSKPLRYSSDTITTSDYSVWEQDFINSRSNDMLIVSCLSVPACANLKVKTAESLASIGAGMYHDTLGNGGNIGCFAESHTYYDTLTQQTITHTHPRGQFTNYFNTVTDNILRDITGACDLSGTDSLAGNGGHKLAQAAEIMVDSNIKHVPAGISLGLASPVDLGIYTRDRDVRRSDFLSDLDYIAVIYGTRRKDSHKLAVPVFPIIYGDRSIVGDFINPTLSNALDYSGYIHDQSISGYNSSNVIELYAATHEQRKQQLRHVVANNFTYFSRFHIYHESLDALDYNNTLGIQEYNSTGSIYYGSLSTENHATLLTGSRWSGYTDYVKQFIRIQAYEPEYVFHGTLDHLLEDYTSTWVTGAYVIYATQANNTSFSEPSGLYDEQTVHHVRKHPTQDSWLVCMTNWSDTTGVFSGTFSPASYNLNNTYNVYSLNVTDPSSYGTKTLLRTVNARDNDVFSVALNPSSTLVYEYVAASGTTLISSSGYVLETTYIPVRYSYRPRTVLTKDFNVAYSYMNESSVSLEDPFEGYRAASTQAIVNNLPSWMKLRQDIESTGWKVVNSWGMQLEKLIEDSVDYTCNMFLETADKKQRYKINYIDLDKTHAGGLRNILYNSAFSIKDLGRNYLPAGWTSYGRTGTSLVYDKECLIGVPIEIVNSRLSQTVYVSSVIEKFTLSVYCLIPTVDSSVKIIISSESLDGTNTMQEATLSTRSSEWRRLVTTLTVCDEVYRVKITILGSGAAVYVSAPQLEIGNSATFWTRNVKDRPAWIRSDSSKLNIVQAINTTSVKTKTPILPVGTEEEFLNIEIPTRVELISSRVGDVELEATQEYGRRLSYQNELYPTQWIVSEGKVEERSLSPTVWDKFADYDIRELRYTSDGLYGTRQDTSVSITPLKSLIRNKLLFVLCLEEKDESTYYTLKITKPFTPPNGENYLESFTDFVLNIPLQNLYGTNQVEETITSIGLDSSDDRLFVINTNIGRQFIYKLYFDYYYLNQRENRIYMLEDYGNAKIQVQ